MERQSSGVAVTEAKEKAHRYSTTYNNSATIKSNMCDEEVAFMAFAVNLLVI